MWREHDAKLASVWRREESDSESEAAASDTVIVPPEPSESVAHTA
jgi:hypothetical protein